MLSIWTNLKIKALKALVWHLSREPMEGINNLKNICHIYNYMTNKPKDEQTQGQTDLGMNTVSSPRSCVSLCQ